MLKMKIGLEIHVQLATATKAFCSCSTDSIGATANQNICPVCTGQPGALPTYNSEMIRLSVKAAKGLRCKLNTISGFDRKNYLYPDLPKGYQITQFFTPLAENGFLSLYNNRSKKIPVKRLHMEEDSGKTTYRTDEKTNRREQLIDYNRSGIPLIEIVTDPVLDSPGEASQFFDLLRITLIQLGITNGGLEKGEMRCDANISVQDTETGQKTGKIEIKNLNSFKHMRQALVYEEDRLGRTLSSGEVEPSQTRGWDEKGRITYLLRTKESVSDYRYLPEPNLPLIDLAKLPDINLVIPELPDELLQRLIAEYGLSEANAIVLTREPTLCRLFEETAKTVNPRTIIKWLMGEIRKNLNETGRTVDETKLTPLKLKDLIENIKSGKITNSVGKRLLKKLMTSEKSVIDLIEETGMAQIRDRDYLDEVFLKLMADHPEQVEAYRYGKEGLLKYFIGLMMKKTRGKSDPGIVAQIAKRRLDERKK